MEKRDRKLDRQIDTHNTTRTQHTRTHTETCKSSERWAVSMEKHCVVVVVGMSVNGPKLRSKMAVWQPDCTRSHSSTRR